MYCLAVMYVCMQWYVWFFVYVCMHVFIVVANRWVAIHTVVVFHPYLYHIGEPQRDEEIDGEERDGEGGKTETMYVCMSGWMCMDRGRYFC